MKKPILVICDGEKEFAYNFMEYFISRKNCYFEIQVFTEVDNLLEYVKSEYISIMLIASDMMSQVIEELNIGKIIILSEGEVRKQYFEYPVVYKYQSSEKIIKDVLNNYAQNVAEEPINEFFGKKSAIIGIYSPVKRSMKTSFAITIGQLLSKEKEVIYFNLEEYSGLQYIMNENYREDILDLLYFERQQKGSGAIKVRSMAGHIDKLDYIAPAIYTEELKKIRSEEWGSLIEKLLINSGYDIIILDLGDMIDGIADILECCETVFMPQSSEYIAKEKVNQFENYLKSIGKEELLEKIVHLNLPNISSKLDGIDYYREIVSNEFGEYCNKVLMECIYG